MHIGERGTAFSVEKKAVPSEANVSPDKTVPGSFNLVHGLKLRLGSNAAQLLQVLHLLPHAAVNKELVHLEVVEPALCAAAIADKASFGANHDVAKLKSVSSLRTPDRLGIVLMMAGPIERGKSVCLIAKPDA